MIDYDLLVKEYFMSTKHRISSFDVYISDEETYLSMPLKESREYKKYSNGLEEGFHFSVPLFERCVIVNKMNRLYLLNLHSGEYADITHYPLEIRTFLVKRLCNNFSFVDYIEEGDIPLVKEIMLEVERKIKEEDYDITKEMIIPYLIRMELKKKKSGLKLELIY